MSSRATAKVAGGRISRQICPQNVRRAMARAIRRGCASADTIAEAENSAKALIDMPLIVMLRTSGEAGFRLASQSLAVTGAEFYKGVNIGPAIR